MIKTIYTIGHSTLPIEDFIAHLHENKIKVLADLTAWLIYPKAENAQKEFIFV